MFVVVYRREYRIVQAKQFREPIPFIPLLVRRVQRLVELRSGDVELIRIDSDDGPIHFMKIANVESVLTIKGVDVVVEFVPEVWSDGA
jgi:hypothetical protein